jgi:hypothetical protein
VHIEQRRPVALVITAGDGLAVDDAGPGAQPRKSVNKKACRFGASPNELELIAQKG